MRILEGRRRQSLADPLDLGAGEGEDPQGLCFPQVPGRSQRKESRISWSWIMYSHLSFPGA